jgi:Protein of unknown function (DUF2842)
MKMRTRKLIGTVATVIFLGLYCLVVMALGGIFVVGKGFLAELPFYVVAGFGWLPVVMMLIKWMSQPDSVAPNAR